MRILFPTAVLALLLASPGTASAQSASKCPDLPANSGLVWQEIQSDTLLFCRAVRTDGSDAFALTFTRKPTFEPDRRNSADVSTFDGQSLQWYRSTLAGNPNLLVRESLVRLNDGTTLQMVVRSGDDAGLQRAFSEISALKISAVAIR